MTTAVLFWCYKDPDTCVDRLRLLRHHNPDIPIYVLYGGEPGTSQEMATALAPYFDDFWSYEEPRKAYFKWKNGDQMITQWFNARGKDLPAWTSLFIMQWDMLVAGNLGQILANVPKDACVFGGRKRVSDIREWWIWVHGYKFRKKELLFRLRLAVKERYFGALYCAPFILVVVPRSYLKRLAADPYPMLGFLEYRWPTLAEAWGYLTHFEPGLSAGHTATANHYDGPEVDHVVHPHRDPIPVERIKAQLSRPGGRRLFHPVFDRDDDLDVGELLWNPA